MARNNTVKADAHAPAVTALLANFAVDHPSRCWDDAVEREAHRTFANWVGCAIGPSHHETVEAALTAVQELQPSAQTSLLGRPEKVDIASAALLNGISSHTWDFDDVLALRAKFTGQADPVLVADKAGVARALAMDIAQQPDLRAFIAAAT